MGSLRVFLDTSVIGGFLRDNPGRADDFKQAQAAGVRFYASTDVISEIYCNPDLDSFKVQLAALRSLVGDGCFYRAPIGMVRADLHKLQNRPLINLLEPASEVSRKIDSMTRRHSSEEVRTIRESHRAEKKQFFDDDRAATQKVLEIRKTGDFLPSSLGEFARQAREMESTHPLELITRALRCPLSDRDWKKLSENPQDYRALAVYALISRLVPYSRAAKLSKPGKGDAIDVRHTVASAYCEAFITNDRALREFLKQGGKLIPYKVYSPQEFLGDEAYS